MAHKKRKPVRVKGKLVIPKGIDKPSERERRRSVSGIRDVKRGLSPKDPAREELRQKEIRDRKLQKFTTKEGKTGFTTFAEDLEQKEIEAVARRSFEIGLEKERLGKMETIEPGEIPPIPEAITQVIGGKVRGAVDFLIEDIEEVRIKLAAPETGTTFDKINRWRLTTKLSNLENRTMLKGSLPIGLPIGSAAGIARAGLTLGTKPSTVGNTLGFATTSGRIANNAKTVALTGTWLKNIGFTTRAIVVVGGLISTIPWAKHVKSEALEFIPFNLQRAIKDGDEIAIVQLNEFFDEVADPEGWANVLEEFPITNVIKAAFDKVRVAKIIMDQLNRRIPESPDENS